MLLTPRRLSPAALLALLVASPAPAQFESTQVSGPGRTPLLMTKSVMQWEDIGPSVPGALYNVYRRTPGDGFRCLVSNLTTNSWTGDPANPSAEVWWYSVVADDGWGENLHGNGIPIVERCPCSGVIAVPGTPPLRLEPIASGLCSPVHLAHAPGDPSRLFVVEQYTGNVRLIRRGQLDPTPFLTLPVPLTANNEEGFLSIAFHPQYQTNGRFFVNYTREPQCPTPPCPEVSDSETAEYRVSANPDRADPNPVQILHVVDQPFTNHNGGQLAFSPLDGYLYIGYGDGGSGNDPQFNGQCLDTPLGKLLRIDVDSATPYAVPPDNPFLGMACARPEVWALGLRNPWRFSFDRANGDLYIGDVGQGCFEEIDVIPGTLGGANFGWRNLEGNHCRGLGCTDTTPCSGCRIDGCLAPRNCSPANSCAQLTPPVVEYGRSLGVSVTGGHVYRGCRMPGHDGRYFYADYGSGRIWSFIYSGGVATSSIDHEPELGRPSSPTSFGVDARGEIYLVRRGSSTGCTGTVSRLAPN